MALDLRTGLLGLLGRGGPALLELGLLRGGLVALGLEAPDLCGHRRELAPQPGDVALDACVALTGVSQARLCLGDCLRGVPQGLLEPVEAIAQHAHAALALERAPLGVGTATHDDASVREHRDARFRHVRERGVRVVGAHRLGRVPHDAHVPQQGAHEAGRRFGNADALEQRDAGRVGFRDGTRGTPRHDRRLARGLRESLRTRGKRHGGLRVRNDERRHLPQETRLLLSMANALGAGRMRQASRELIKVYALGCDSGALDDVMELVAWNQGIGTFASEVGPSTFFRAYRTIKEQEAKGKPRSEIVGMLMERFGEQNPDVGVQ